MYYELIQPVFNHESNTVALFLDDTLDIDASIDEEDGKTRFGILGSDRTMYQPQNATLVCGQIVAKQSTRVDFSKS